MNGVSSALNNKRTIPDKDLYQLYYEDRVSCREIGGLYGLSVSAVTKQMRELRWPKISRAERNNQGIPQGDAWPILMGCIVGDGHLHKNKKNARFEVKHTIRQEDYIDWKIDKLCRWMDFSYKKERESEIGAPVLHAVSHTYTWLTDIYEWFYAERGRRIISDEAFANMNELSLAVWYLDDGTYNTVRWNDYVTIATLRYGREGNERIRDWLYSKWGLTPSIYTDPRRKEGIADSLQFNKKDSEFIREITSEITKDVPSMRYKV